MTEWSIQITRKRDGFIEADVVMEKKMNEWEGERYGLWLLGGEMI